jgi:hypothetical protein
VDYVAFLVDGSGRLNSNFSSKHNKKSLKINNVYAAVKRESGLKIRLVADYKHDTNNMFNSFLYRSKYFKASFPITDESIGGKKKMDYIRNKNIL